MFNRKLKVSLIVALIASLIFSILISTYYAQNLFYVWVAVSMFLFPILFFYALPISLLSELITRKIGNQIIRRSLSLGIHVGLASIIIFWFKEYLIYALITAIIFFIVDEITRFYKRRAL